MIARPQRLESRRPDPGEGSPESTRLAGDLLGRDAELATLSARIDTASRGEGTMAWLEGQGGIGKTRLLLAVADVARERGLTVLSASAVELESHRPFGVVADSLDVARRSSDERRAAIGRSLLETPPIESDATGVPAGGGALGFALAEDLLGLVEDACARSPTLLVLDDLQWADASSLAFLGRLSRELPDLPLLVVAAMRPLPRPPELERLVTVTVSRRAVRIGLGPLDEAASRALAARLAGGELGPALSERVEACGGNPLFVSELIKALRRDGSIELGPGRRAETAREAAPRGLARTMLSRLGFLSPEAAEVIELASVLGSSFSVADLSLMSGRPAAFHWQFLREAMAAGILEERGDRLAFRHDVVHEALHAELPKAVRAALHRDLARALAERGAPIGRVAEHVLRGAEPGDRDAVAWLERAAKEAAPLGAQVAAELLEEAVRLADAGDPARPRLVAELALNLAVAGRHSRAQKLCREGLEHAPTSDVEGAVRLCLAESLISQGRVPEALEHVQLAAGSPALSARDRARALSWLAAMALWSRDQAATVAAAMSALEAGEQAAHAGVIAQAHDILGHVAGFRGDFFEQERLIGEAAAVAQRANAPEAHSSVPQVDHAMALADCDRFEEAIRAIAAGRRAYARLGLEQAMAMSPAFAGYVLFSAGEWDDALTEWETVGSFPEEIGAGWQVDALSGRAVVLARRGELERAQSS